MVALMTQHGVMPVSNMLPQAFKTARTHPGDAIGQAPLDGLDDALARALPEQAHQHQRLHVHLHHSVWSAALSTLTPQDWRISSHDGGSCTALA